VSELLPPAIASDDDYARRLGDGTFWEPLVRAALDYLVGTPEIVTSEISRLRLALPFDRLIFWARPPGLSVERAAHARSSCSPRRSSPTSRAEHSHSRGTTRRVAIQASSSSTSKRTNLPTLVYGTRRSWQSRRMKRRLTFSRSAASSGLSRGLIWPFWPFCDPFRRFWLM
jgi:hypothetical protein